MITAAYLDTCIFRDLRGNNISARKSLSRRIRPALNKYIIKAQVPYSVNQRALECVAYVHEGVNLTGRGKNNCTNPELTPLIFRRSPFCL
jgi:hypothetical protein